MPRHAEVDRPVALKLMLPESVRTKLALHLYSEVEQRVPQGAYQSFFLQRIIEFFSWKRLDLGQGLFIMGPPEAIEKLKELTGVR